MHSSSLSAQQQLLSFQFRLMSGTIILTPVHFVTWYALRIEYCALFSSPDHIHGCHCDHMIMAATIQGCRVAEVSPIDPTL